MLPGGPDPREFNDAQALETPVHKYLELLGDEERKRQVESLWEIAKQFDEIRKRLRNLGQKTYAELFAKA